MVLYHIFSTLDYPGNLVSHCGKSVGDVYRDLSDSVLREGSIEFSCLWHEGDHVCVACIRRARPLHPREIQVCRDVNAGQWAVLCDCGCVRPYGTTCGLIYDAKNVTIRIDGVDMTQDLSYEYLDRKS